MERVDGGEAEGWFHPRATRAFRGSGPIEAVSVHRVGDHWHLVTYGLTELHSKESPDSRFSGWGFELTFRVVDDEIPLWAVDFMASLASYVWSSRHPFAPGHLMDLRGPIRIGSQSAITAAMIVADPGLAQLDGPFGRVDFLQVVGLTAAELELCRAWNTEGVADLLVRQDRLMVTRLDRPDLNADPALASEAADRAAADGSALHELRIATLKLHRRWRGRADVEMGSGAAAALGPALRRELVAPGASFVVVGDESALRFVLADSAGWDWTADGIEARVVPDGVEHVAGLFDGRTGWGHASDWPHLRFHVVK